MTASRGEFGPLGFIPRVILLLGILHRADRVPHAPIAVGLGVELANEVIMEPHVVSGGVIPVRGRPVAAQVAHIVDKRAKAALARCGQEHRTGGLHRGPLGGGVTVGPIAVTRGKRAPVGQRPVVGQDDHTVDPVDTAMPILGCSAFPGVEEVCPLVMGQCAPLVGGVAAVADGIVPCPVGIGAGTSQVVVVVATRIEIVGHVAGVVGHVSVGTAVPPAGAPAEEVYPIRVVFRI